MISGISELTRDPAPGCTVLPASNATAAWANLKHLNLQSAFEPGAEVETCVPLVEYMHFLLGKNGQDTCPGSAKALEGLGLATRRRQR